MHNARLIWTQWYGVPMHAWKPNFFKLILLKYGSLIKIDDDTMKRKNIHRARILIRTPLPEISKTPFNISVDDKVISIRIKEEDEDFYKIENDSNGDTTCDMEDEDDGIDTDLVSL